jgi:hypothetical protein
MIKALVIVVILLSSSVVQAQWKRDGKSVEYTPDRKSIGAFGGQLLIVRDPKAFFEEWQKPEMPKITPVTEVQRGELVAALALFAGCKPDAQGTCNCEVDYFFYRADGSLYAERKSQPLWKNRLRLQQIPNWAKPFWAFDWKTLTHLATIRSRPGFRCKCSDLI